VHAKKHTGQSGHCYVVEDVLQEEDFLRRLVYLAMQGTQRIFHKICFQHFISAGGHNFILKYVPEGSFEYHQDVNNRLRGGANHFRLVEDIIPEISTFVFPVTGHLLRRPQKGLPLLRENRS
jgi:hypothetical protein